ncbi:hypothetical protein EFB08_02150 [Rufibacter latericius]|uniref:Macroglobulin domain-containing protein n=1 Tax=Rufibacter latericius TaxID=2487040 RepID=A0A3M9N0P9_9BACT|nr:hypothetical protein EFB08_02150 [Rufibacter latericius]
MLLLLVPLTGFTFMADSWKTALKQGLVQQENKEKEQIHVRFSQPYYASGDTVRFKAYVLNAASLQPTRQSHVLEVEFRTPAMATTQHLRFAVQDGIALGSFVLPDSLSRGQYEVVAYTPAMLAGGKKEAFQQRLRVLGPATDKSKAEATTPISVTLTAFPEGGKLVSQVQSRVAIKATDQSGMGVATKGRIIGASGAATPFSTNERGEGLVLFTPQGSGDGYRWALENTSASLSLNEAKFPTVETQGVGLRVQTGPDSLLRLTLLPNAAWLQKRGDKRVQVMFQADGKTVFSTGEKLSKPEGTEVVVPRGKFPAGLLAVTIANADGQVEAQRLVLLQHPNHLQIQVKTDRIRYGRREPVRITASVIDAAGNPVEASLSFAVRTRSQADALRASSLEQTVLGRGVPALIPGKSASQLLDSTLEWSLLTQTGLKDFRFGPVSGKSTQNEAVAFEGLQIEGRVVDANGAPMETSTVLLYGKRSEEPMLFTPGPDGRFSFQSPEFVHPDQFTFEVLRGGSRLREAKLEWINLPIFAAASPLPLQLTETEARYLKQIALQRRSNSLFHSKGGIIKSGQQDSVAALLSELGRPDQSIDLSKYITFKDLAEVVKETLPLASVVETDDGKQIRIFSPERVGAKFKEHPLYFIDGVPTLNNDWLLKLPGNSIRKIDLFYAQRKLSNLGLIGRHGVLSVTTQAPHPAPKDFQDNRTLGWSGLAPVHAFNTPSYEYTVPKPAPDFRNLLFWAPQILTDAKGNGSVTFYTSDDVGDFEVEVEAYSKSGLLGSQFYRFSVVPNL